MASYITFTGWALASALAVVGCAAPLPPELDIPFELANAKAEEHYERAPGYLPRIKGKFEERLVRYVVGPRWRN